jgi:hypothetical protein
MNRTAEFSVIRIVAASVFVAAGSAFTNVTLAGKAGALGMPAVILCILGAGISLWSRFGNYRIGARLAAIGKELVETPVKLSAFTSGLLWLAFGMVLGRLVWIVFGPVLLTLNGGLFEIVGWCGVGGTAVCLLKCVSDWREAFKLSGPLDDERAHGDARDATEQEARRATRGGRQSSADRRMPN